MKLRQNQSNKLSFSSTLRSWLPILQSDIETLEETIEPFVKDNPFVNVKSGFEKNKSHIHTDKSWTTDVIESLTFSKKSLYDVLYDQISPPLFPTSKSQNIAFGIIENIDENGYFIGNISALAVRYNCKSDEIEKIRKRFSYLEPIGVGAKNLKESFLFQLDDMNIDNNLYKLTKKLIQDFENIENYAKEVDFSKAIKIIKKFTSPPALEYFEESKQIIPDIFVFEKENKIEIKINNDYYPKIILDLDGVEIKEKYVQEKIKSAKDLVDALKMRKATLYKIGLMILEYQYDFFKGGDIKPMRLKDLAQELDRNPSTISRAISNKYLSCNRGIFLLKDFFSTAINEDISNTLIKDFIVQLIKSEERKKPLSDSKILDKIEEKFGIKIVRRTITKYRKQLNIAGSSERKKLYLLS